MCGIAGVVSFELNSSLMVNNIKLMIKDIQHRGPDFNNFYFSKDNETILGHTRLSIIDLSTNGNQPMILSNNKNYVLVYNGEIYNFNELKELINKDYKIKWNSNTDTEVLLQCINLWGIKKTLNYLRGMFAFALYDYKKNEITIVRDHFGQKPIFYYFDKVNFAFSSEIKSLSNVSFFKKEIDKNSIFNFLNFSYIPAPKTIYTNCYKLEPGSLLKIKISKIKKKIYLKKFRWWKSEQNNKQISINKNLTLNQYSEIFEKKFYKTINEQMVCDVSIGSFLSGGIDSSLVSIFMQKLNTKKIDTFSIKFKNENYDESKFSDYISKTIGSVHHQIQIDEINFKDAIEEIIDVYGEPFADSSQIPTILISKFTKKKVKVCLSGDGADELFGGYNRYKYIPICWKFFKLLGLKYNFNKFVFQFFLKNLNFFLVPIIQLFLGRNDKQIQYKIDKFIRIIQNAKNQHDLYINLISNNALGNKFDLDLNNNLKFNNNNSIEETMMIMDQMDYLPNDILYKVDHASMSVGLETRMPFLDLNIFKFSKSLPLKYKVNKNETKILLKNVLKKYTNEKFVNREKMGFSIPLKEWLRGPLKNIVLECEKKINSKKYDFLCNLNISEKISNFYNKNADTQNYLWNIIILIYWLEKND